MQTALKPRCARLGDLAPITALERQLFGDLSYPYSIFRQLLDAYGSNLHVIDDGGEIIAYAMAIIAEDSSTAWIWSVGVRPDRRRQGAGRLIVSHALAGLDRAGATRVLLTVDPANRAAVALYESLGFHPAALAKDYFGDNQDRLRMELAF